MPAIGTSCGVSRKRPFQWRFRRYGSRSKACITVRAWRRRGSHTPTISFFRAPRTPWPRCGARPTLTPIPAFATCSSTSSSKPSGACRFSIGISRYNTAVLAAHKSTVSSPASTTSHRRSPRFPPDTTLETNCPGWSRRSIEQAPGERPPASRPRARPHRLGSPTIRSTTSSPTRPSARTSTTPISTSWSNPGTGC